MAMQVQEAESGGEGGLDSRGIGGCSGSGTVQEGRRNWHKVTRLETGGLILALQVLLGDLDIQQGHVGIMMAQ